MHVAVEGAVVRAIASTVPQNVLQVDSLVNQFGDLKRIIAGSGIRELRIADPEITTADLCAHAARRLFDSVPLDPHSVDGLLFVSQTPDYRLPATSAVLQHKLGLPRDLVTFDVNHGCVGHVYGLFQAATLIASGACRRVLVLAGDTISKLVSPRDRTIRVLMGDAGSATLVEKGEGTLTFDLRTDGERFECLIVPAGGARRPHAAETAVATEHPDGNWRSPDHLFMDGLKITEFALSEVIPLIQESLDANSLRIADLDQVIFHQASRFIVSSMTNRLGLPEDKAPLLVERFGNTSSASIPMTLCQKFGTLEPQQRNSELRNTMLVGFGVGLCWGTALADLSRTRIFPVEDLS